MPLTIIIPTLNEASKLPSTLHAVRINAKTNDISIIVADGGSTDNTCRIAREYGARVVVVKGGPRSAQLNLAASQTSSDSLLLFLHADTLPGPSFDVVLSSALSKSNVVAGAYPLSIANARGCLRVVQFFANLRARAGAPYGDQGLFLCREMFDRVGGYPKMTFLEDYEIVRRLRREGHFVIVGPPVITSARRWNVLGVVRTTIMNQCVIAGYHLGVPVGRLRNWYRGTLARANARVKAR